MRAIPRASWGRYPIRQQQILETPWIDHAEFQDLARTHRVLPYGLGRSYGDSCLNTDGLLVGTRLRSHFLSFDQQSGVLRAQSGVSLEDIIRVCLPRGWFLPVTPGTKYVTLGGAVANDVHGKNHHRRGTFGCHVKALGLWKSDGGPLTCSPSQNASLFFATIGGMGLTGFIDWIEIQLIPVVSSYWDVEVIKFESLEEFIALEKASHESFEYTVAWVDGLSPRGRGHFIRGNPSSDRNDFPLHRQKVTVPCDFPTGALNSWTVKAFNFAYYHRILGTSKRGQVHYDPFFYPLDGISDWNRIYGKNGFLQYQFVLPDQNAEAGMREIMVKIAQNPEASFLTVLKRFGSMSSGGLMSFPRPGLTYALDFPVSEKSFSLLRELDQIVIAAEGALYPAKDARMSADLFRRSFPRWEEFSSFVDPRFSSDFWSRVTKLGK